MLHIRTILALVMATAVSAPLGAANPGRAILLDADRANGCALTVSDAGKALLIEARGLIPGESYRFTLTNGDMTPVEFAGYATGDGSFIQSYVPFRFNREGGLVRVRVGAANCTMDVTAPWRRSVPVIN